jgi:adenylate cyclase
MKMMGRRSSRGSPNICNICDELLPRGGAEVEIGVLFGDVRGSTALGESMGASAFAALLNRFYGAAMGPLLEHDAVIDKMVGDEVMALFIPSVAGPDYGGAAVRAAENLMRAVGYGGEEDAWLPLGIGVTVGTAYVGKVGTEGINDFTALGDTVNTA